MPVAQHLADIHKRRALREHLARQRVSEPVRPDVLNPSAFARSLDNIANQIRADRTCRARNVKNTRRNPRRPRAVRYSASATPTSSSNGRRSCRRLFPCTTSSPARQSTSESSSRATSTDRNPNRASSSKIAASRAPSNVELSQHAISRSTSPRGTARNPGVPPARDRGTESASASAVNPRTNKNRNSDRSSSTFPFADETDSRSHSRSRNAATSSPPSSLHAQIVPCVRPLTEEPPGERLISPDSQRREPALVHQPLPVLSISSTSGVDGTSRSRPATPNSRR